MAEVIIPTLDGGTMGGYLAPAQQGSGNGVLVIQEIFGVNAGVRAICDHFAAKGFFTLAPDLFWRLKPGVQLTDKTDAEWAQAMDYLNKFNVDLGVTDLIAALGFLRQYKGCGGKVGTVGYCLGGKLSYLMATRSDVDCAVSYYGVGIQDMLDEAVEIRHPFLMHIAGADHFVPPDAQQKIKERMARNPLVTVHIYDGMDHAFARPNGVKYNAAAATLANQRTDDFFGVHLVK